MRLQAPCPKPYKVVEWGVEWVNGVGEVSNEYLANKLIRKGYAILEVVKEVKKPSKSKK